jgi:hypothetical protein
MIRFRVFVFRAAKYRIILAGRKMYKKNRLEKTMDGPPSWVGFLWIRVSSTKFLQTLVMIPFFSYNYKGIFPLFLWDFPPGFWEGAGGEDRSTAVKPFSFYSPCRFLSRYGGTPHG